LDKAHMRAFAYSSRILIKSAHMRFTEFNRSRTCATAHVSEIPQFGNIACTEDFQY